MLSRGLVGRRVKVTAWYDIEQLAADPRWSIASGDAPEGVVTHVNDVNGRVWVRIDGLNHDCNLASSDVEVVP